jgi:hypothetical protein
MRWFHGGITTIYRLGCLETTSLNIRKKPEEIIANCGQKIELSSSKSKKFGKIPSAPR